MNAKDRKKYFIRQEQFSELVEEHRKEIYSHAQHLENLLQSYLREEASKQETEEIFFYPYKGRVGLRKVRVVYFNNTIRIHDPEGTVQEPFFLCRKLIEMPADGKINPREWLLEDNKGLQVYMHDLSVDCLLLLSDRLADPDCSLDPNWRWDTK